MDGIPADHLRGENNYFIKDYLKPGEVAAMPNVDANLLAYHVAKEASIKKGLRYIMPHAEENSRFFRE